MPDRLADLTLSAFGDALASDAPVPGGGSAAAYAGAMGAGLVAMVARIALRKVEDGGLRAYADEMDALRRDFLRMVDDDSSAYALVADAMKLPKATDDEKRLRGERMQAAFLSAARVPLEVARAGRRLLEACERGVEKAPAAAVSDIGVGALMAEAALRGAALNVKINLASLKDRARAASLSEDLDTSLAGADAQRARIMNVVESRIAR